MKFTHSIIGRNTKKHREWIEQLGYGEYIIWYYGEDGKEKSSLIAGMSSDFHPMIQKDIDKIISDGTVVDCTHSDYLFCAVSAIREDSDKGKYFREKGSGELVLCNTHSFITYFSHYLGTGSYTEATLEELKEHFK